MIQLIVPLIKDTILESNPLSTKISSSIALNGKMKTSINQQTDLDPRLTYFQSNPKSQYDCKGYQNATNSLTHLHRIKPILSTDGHSLKIPIPSSTKEQPMKYTCSGSQTNPSVEGLTSSSITWFSILSDFIFFACSGVIDSNCLRSVIFTFSPISGGQRCRQIYFS